MQIPVGLNLGAGSVLLPQLDLNKIYQITYPWVSAQYVLELNYLRSRPHPASHPYPLHQSSAKKLTVAYPGYMKTYASNH